MRVRPHRALILMCALHTYAPVPIDADVDVGPVTGSTVHNQMVTSAPHKQTMPADVDSE